MAKKNKLLFSAGFLAFVFLFSCAGMKSAASEKEGSGPNNLIICFGDSITTGVSEGNWNGENLNQAYPAALQRRVRIPVLNAGVQGDTTASALRRLEGDALSKDPGIVIINLGINDFLQGFDIERTDRNFNIMLQNLQRAGRKIYIAKFFTDDILRQKMRSWGFPMEQREEIIAGYNYMYISLARKYNAEILSDIWRGVWGEHMTDDIHPDARGYGIMADTIFGYMRPYLAEKGFL
jgi:acyl-CoA thioesterase-1